MRMESSPSDRNGYAPSLLQEDMSRCFLCGRCDRKLDRHEIFPAANRSKSKEDGLWVLLCHSDCHEGKNGAHGNRKVRDYLSRTAQRKAMETYGWTLAEWLTRYGKNWL